MNVEFTGRQYEITPAVRKQVEHGLAKIKKILGSAFETKVILSTEKRRHIAEITITVRNHDPLVGAAYAAEMQSAVGEALDRLDRQAVKYRTKWKSKKQKARKKFNGEAVAEQIAVAVGASAATAVPVVAHSFPSAARLTETHIVRGNDNVAIRPLSVEEAVKEAEFRDREVFVFRDLEGRVKVLHRKKDGKMELIDAP